MLIAQGVAARIACTEHNRERRMILFFKDAQALCLGHPSRFHLNRDRRSTDLREKLDLRPTLPPADQVFPAAVLEFLENEVLGEEYLLDLAVTSGFYKRSPRKISACFMLAAICSEAAKGSPSCNDLAASIESNHPGQGPSRQAVHLRMGNPLQAFVHRLLEDLISGSISGATARISSLEDRDRQFGGYTRVLVQDSTIIKLPVHLFEEFSGVSNAHSKVCNARIQATYDLPAPSLIDFSIDPYSKNDQSAAPELPIEAGDLVLRDRGYLLPKEIQRHAEAGADCSGGGRFPCSRTSAATPGDGSSLDSLVPCTNYSTLLAVCPPRAWLFKLDGFGRV
jgi:hypothetical protein